MRPVTQGQIEEVMRQFGAKQVDFDRAQAFITNRTPAEMAAATTLRELQARRLWEKRKGDVLGCETFERYLNGTDFLEPIPEVLVFPTEHVRLFGPQGIFLVDGRVPEKIGLVEYAKLIGLAYGGQNDTFEPHDSTEAHSGVRWMIGQDGFRNRNRAPSACRKTFAPFEIGGDVIEGIAIWLQGQDVIVDHFMDLPGSVYRDGRKYVAWLGIWDDDRPELRWYWGDDDGAGLRCGSVSRGKKVLSA